jgi:serine/threonine protein kinase
LGVVLYEMIARQKPFKGETWEAISYAILHRQPEPLARHRSGVSANLQRLIDKALDKNRATRYQNIESLLADLKHEKEFLTDRPQAIMAGADRRKWPGHFSRSVYGLIGIAAVVAGFFLTSEISLLTSASNGKSEPQSSALRDSTGASHMKPDEMNAVLHNAAIYLDGKATGKTTPRQFSVPVGYHTVVNQQQAAGRYSVVWDGRDKNGQTL